MADDSGASLLARKEYAQAVPLLKKEVEKYPSNPRTRLQYADALAGGTRVLVHDDLLATGGTALALCELVEGLGGQVAACSFLIELSFLSGRQRLAPREVQALIDYEA